MSAPSPRLQAIAAAVLFSTGGAAIKTVAFSGMQVSSIRAGIAAAALLLWMRGRVAWSWPAMWIGTVYAATLTLFVSATKLTTAANAIFLQSTAPLYIVILAPLLLGERFRARDATYLGAVGTGLGMCFLGRAEATVTAPNPAAGNVLAVLCSLTWALTLMGLRWGERHRREIGMSSVIAGNLIAFLVGFPFLWPLPPVSAGDWALMGYLGVFQIGVAYIFLTRAMAHLLVLEVSLLLLLEPVLNPIWTWLVHGETPSTWTLVGGALIMLATAGKAIYDTSTRPATARE